MNDLIISERERILIVLALKAKVHHYTTEVQDTEEGSKRDMLRDMLADYQTLLNNLDNGQLASIHISR